MLYSSFLPPILASVQIFDLVSRTFTVCIFDLAYANLLLRMKREGVSLYKYNKGYFGQRY